MMRRGGYFNAEARHESQWIKTQRTSANATVLQNWMYPWTTLSDAFVIQYLNFRVHAGIIPGKICSLKVW